MRISQTKRSKKPFVIATLIVCCLIAVGVFIYSKTRPETPSSTTSSTDSSSEESSVNQQSATNESTSQTTTNSNSQTNVTNQVPTIDTPADDATFPIENAHYRISKGTADTSFDVTLFAVINSSSQYNEYIAQLKQYKSEAKDYLTQRYGNNISITWSPEDANTL